jgi:uncharacterized membrane-anchored protein YitT (DUF2179 family)
MSFLMKEKLFSREWFMNYGQIVLGALIMAAGYAFFADPMKIVPGGVFGISIVIHHLFGLPTGTMALIFNVPLFIAGIYILGPRFGVKTFLGTVLTSFFIDTLSHFGGGKALTTDIMLGSVVSGVLIGVGLALIFRAGATTGGSDIIAQIANKYSRIPVGKLLIIIDSCIVSVGVIAFKDVSLAAYALITIFITGKVLDSILMGQHYSKGVFIISDKHEEIRQKLLTGIDRGGTYFYGQGMYEGKEKKIIFTAVSRRDFMLLHDFIKKVDPHAFITVFESHEVMGEGFQPISD